MSAVQFKHRFSRPAVAEKRLSLTPNGDIRYQLKTPSRDGTTHVIFEPLDFVGRLAALVAKPSVNPTRFHGDFAPNSKHRALVTPAKRGRGGDLLPIGCGRITGSARQTGFTQYCKRLADPVALWGFSVVYRSRGCERFATGAEYRTTTILVVVPRCPVGCWQDSQAICRRTVTMGATPSSRKFH